MVELEFTEKEKEILINMVETEMLTTVSNYSGKAWIKEYIHTRKILIEKIKSMTNSKDKKIAKSTIGKNKVFFREECVFKYCPTPELCKDKCTQI